MQNSRHIPFKNAAVSVPRKTSAVPIVPIDIAGHTAARLIDSRFGPVIELAINNFISLSEPILEQASTIPAVYYPKNFGNTISF